MITPFQARFQVSHRPRPSLNKTEQSLLSFPQRLHWQWQSGLLGKVKVILNYRHYHLSICLPQESNYDILDSYTVL
jgi:hypothetical protein